MAEKNCFDMTKLMFQSMCVTVVQWPRSCLRADKPGSTPGDTVFCFFGPFFFFFLNTIFPSGLFFFILTADPAGYAPGSIYIFKLKSGVLFWKRDFKSF